MLIFNILFLALSRNEYEIVKIILKFTKTINIKNENGEDPLTISIKKDNIEVVKLLLNNDADIDIQDKSGNTPLIWAAKNNNRLIVELLLDYHADEFILNDDNKSFYDYLNHKNKKYFTQKYPNKIYNSILHWYKNPFSKFVTEFNLKIN